MEEDDEVLKILRANNRILAEILAILKQMSDPKNIARENENDFLMNVIANLIAKKLEEKFKI